MLKNSGYDDLISRLKFNSTTSKPYYLQLKRKISALIASGELESGVGLPAERALAEALSISRTTVRRCYEELRELGQLNSNARGGTSIKQARKVSSSLGKLKGFTEEMREQGVAASTFVESHEVMRDRTIASIFNRPSRSSFLRLVRIRLGDDMPMSREVAWRDLTSAPCMGDWDTNRSAYSYLKNSGKIILTHAEQSIEAVLSSAEKSKVFGFAEKSPCLLLKRKSYSTKNQLIEYIEGTLRGDAYAYRVKLKMYEWTACLW